MSHSETVSAALDAKFDSSEGLYGSFESIPIIAQKGHSRRVELLQRLDIGDVSQMVVADFGMGSWGLAAAYPRLHDCRRAIGMDISASAIALSEKLVREANYAYADCFECHQSDGNDLPLADESVDLFFSGESIEHVKFPPRFLCEIYRVLKADGQLVLTTPNRNAVEYRARGEEYCTSPEHFWLFDYEELRRVVEEFFVIEEVYGFNGSFGSYDEDRQRRDEVEAEEWARRFETEPQKATGIVMRLTKKPSVDVYYEIVDVPTSSFRFTESDTLLSLEFGLKGRLMDQPGSELRFTRQASDGIVCRFWCHAWSGLAEVEARGRRTEIDLYSEHPGWRNWISTERAVEPEEIVVRPTLAPGPKAKGIQVIFFEAFTWFRGRRTKQVVAAPAPAVGFQPGYGFERHRPFVATTVFHWFTSNAGNISGPWQPVGGRGTWDGGVAFWKRQIREMMAANIDAIYLHLIEEYEDTRINFFEAYADLRREGWDVPKVAPFIDPNILFRSNPIDVATSAGKDEYARHFIRFFRQYFSKNTDPFASSYLATVDGRLILSTWWVYGLLQNVGALTRDDVVERLRVALADRIPQLAHGIYMVSTALVDPDLSFSDERMVMFSGYAYGIHAVHDSVDVWHVQPGYWDQNIRPQGFFLPRDGGKNYRRAWEAAIGALPYMHRVYVESWNEYDEGSGIFSADPTGPYVNSAFHSNTDTFSDTNDPYEYIRTTAWGASCVNGRPKLAAQVLWFHTEHEYPSLIELSFAVRNEGNDYWTEANGPRLVLMDGHGTRIAAEPITIAEPLGIVRGEVAIVRMTLRRSWLRRLPRIEAVVTVDGSVVGAPVIFANPHADLSMDADAKWRSSPKDMIDDIIFPDVVQENWQMMSWERAALTGLLARIRPKGAIEVGIYYGGSLSLAHQFCEKIVAIDIDPGVVDRFSAPDNAEILISPSVEAIPRAFARLAELGLPVNYVLIDGDHSAEGLRRDIALVLEHVPTEPMFVVMHDSGNPETRRGILSVDWASNPHLHWVDLDFVPGQIIEHAVVAQEQYEVWGGFALAVLFPTPRVGAPEIHQSARTSLASLHRTCDDHGV